MFLEVFQEDTEQAGTEALLSQINSPMVSQLLDEVHITFLINLSQIYSPMGHIHLLIYLFWY